MKNNADIMLSDEAVTYCASDIDLNEHNVDLNENLLREKRQFGGGFRPGDLVVMVASEVDQDMVDTEVMEASDQVVMAGMVVMAVDQVDGILV
ncbi:hypothetical protein FF38_08517 [Lucilia cuprina]|uniref:Uncharacterized protein n=1 Tax=Lucilia cuprina TaxID=7375 RepID=A0A0L0CCH5_LUCCU|nr:hypothetical protein FF38_08517 [Lucilia cuprina]